MAENSFFGSDQEKFIKSGLTVDPPDFLNLVIESCNSSKGVCFSKADVTVEQYLLYRKGLWIANRDAFIKVTFDQLFDSEVITKVAKDGLRVVPPKYTEAFETLVNFFKDLQHHQEALAKVRTYYQHESEMTAALGHHLLSPLTTGHKYAVDQNSNHVLRICPCGSCSCMAEICSGYTNLGANDTWHGNADLVVNDQIPVVQLEIRSDKQEDGYTSWTGSNQYDEDDFLRDSPPPTKKPRQRIDVDPLSPGVVDKLIAVTVTNAFAQINKSKHCEGWLIPTFGFTSGNVVVFLYDPVNDILLQSLEILPLWLDDESSELHLNTVVVLWMLINFTLFTKPYIDQKYVCKKAGFFSCAKSALESYQQMKSTTAFNSYNVNGHALSFFRQRTKKAKTKE